MEALIIIIAELIFAPAIAAAAALCEFLIYFFSAILEFIFGLFGVAVSKEESTDTPNQKQTSKALILLKWIKRFFLFLFIVIVLAYLVIEFFLMDKGIRWALLKIEERSQIVINYESVDASLIKGDFSFSNLRAQRSGNDTLNFDITAEILAIDLAMLSNPFSPATINNIKLAGVNGELQREAKGEQRVQERKQFVINKLNISDVNLKIVDKASERGPFEFDVVLVELNSEPLRSNKALFDIFFRSNISGSINGQPFIIQTKAITDGRETHWQADALPVASLGQFVGAPFSWLDSGTVDVDVYDTWQLNQKADINMDWNFTFNSVSATKPDELTGVTGKLADIAVAYINNRPDPFLIGFGLVMNEEQFYGTSTLAAAGLWKAVMNGMTKKLAEATNNTQERVKEGFDNNIDKIKSFLDKKRKGET